MTTCEHGALARTCIICSEWKPRALEAEEERDRLREALTNAHELLGMSEHGTKARKILECIARKNAAGEDITLAHDWGLGSGTLVFGDESHTHFGSDTEDDEAKAIEDYIDGLHDLLVEGRGLSVVGP